jgi:hypothetical protein
LPIVALVLALMGMCVPLFGCIGLVLGIIGIVAATRNPSYGRMGFSIGAVVSSSLIMVILTAIAVPAFFRYKARAEQSECKANLKAAAIAERQWLADHETYELNPEAVGFKPERGNRYLYRLGPDAKSVIEADKARFPEVDNAALDAALRKHVPDLGVTGKCPDCKVTMACAGNIDRDEENDVWSVSTADRPGVPANTPFNDFSDLTDEPGDIQR